MFKKISIVFTAFVLIGACCAFIRLSRSKAQETQTHNIRIEDYPNFFQNKEPVKIIGLYLGTDPIKSGEDFQAGKDWIRNLGFRIKNVSDQSIREVILDLEAVTGKMPDGSSIIERVEIRYGRDYWYSPKPDERVQERLLRPGETTIVSFDPNYKDTDLLLRSNQRRLGLPFPNRGYVALGEVVFEDTDKSWRMRSYLKRTGNGWIGDPDKAHLNGGNSSQGRVRVKGKGNSLLSQQAPLTFANCWDYYNPPVYGITSCVDSHPGCDAPDCHGCEYIQNGLQRNPGGGYRLRYVTRICYHSVMVGIDCLIDTSNACIETDTGYLCVTTLIADLDPNQVC